MTITLEPGRQPIEPRFWSKVDKRGPNDCWEWTGARKELGYGVLGINGRTQRAHRISLHLHGTMLTDSDVVRHSCDNPPCVNPAHLLVGTLKDNTADMLTRGRHRTNPARGKRNGNAKVTEQDVLRIRELAAAGTPLTAIARDFAIGATMVGYIVHRRYWKHI